MSVETGTVKQVQIVIITMVVLLVSLPNVAFAQTQSTDGTGTPFQEEKLQLRGLEPTTIKPPANSLDQIRQESEITSSAMFVEPDQVMVKAPVLKALIQLDSKLSPYQLDADSERPISLHDTLKTALDNNLAIKISHSDQESVKWQCYSALGGFLPNLINGVGYQVLKGKFASPFGVLVPINNAYLVIPDSVNYYFFQGGKVLYSALQTRHNYRASQYSLKGTTNDILFDAAKLYYNLALNDVLLQIRVKAVEVSQALVLRNQDLFDNGVNTMLDVLQARTQLSKDRQHLITQQIARRQSAINLATALNLNPAVDLSVENRMVSKIRLVDPTLRPNDLLKIAIDNRPELKHYEQLRLAAKDAINVARAPLFPTVLGTGTAASTAARVSTSGVTSQSSAAAAAVAVGSFNTSSLAPISGRSNNPRFTMTEIFQLGIDVEWQLGGLGTIAAANVQSAKWQARKAQLEFNKELAKVYQEVRNTFLDGIDAENLINETTDAVNSAREQLNVANIRLEEGVGTDLDAVHAQRDYTNALIDKANAIIQFNIAQASILRAIGRISLDALTSLVPLRQ